jgi:hypothetical protein
MMKNYLKVSKNDLKSNKYQKMQRKCKIKISYLDSDANETQLWLRNCSNSIQQIILIVQ